MDRLQQTRDISSGGVCFLSPVSIEPGGRIEYLITLSGSAPAVCIRCLGKVLRSQRPAPAEPIAGNDGNPHFEVAVTMERYQFVRPEEMEAFSLAS